MIAKRRGQVDILELQGIRLARPAGWCAWALLVGLGTGCSSTVHTAHLDAQGAAEVAHYAAGGGVVLALDPENRDLVCAYPPEDAADASDRTSQFLDVALYRLCEAHANGLLGGRCDGALRELEAAPGQPERSAAMKAYSDCLSTCDAPRSVAASLRDAERTALSSLSEARAAAERATLATSQLGRARQLDKQVLDLTAKRSAAQDKAVQEELDRQLAAARDERKAISLTDEEREAAALASATNLRVKDAEGALASARASKKAAERSVTECEGSLLSGYERTFRLLVETQLELQAAAAREPKPKPKPKKASPSKPPRRAPNAEAK